MLQGSQERIVNTLNRTSATCPSPAGMEELVIPTARKHMSVSVLQVTQVGFCVCTSRLPPLWITSSWNVLGQSEYALKFTSSCTGNEKKSKRLPFAFFGHGVGNQTLYPLHVSRKTFRSCGVVHVGKLTARATLEWLLHFWVQSLPSGKNEVNLASKTFLWENYNWVPAGKHGNPLHSWREHRRRVTVSV